ncbi:hypothetical protein [Sphaerisporangium album]|uniref:hypothetical protein n=1 Tax=Sphaerisporangium album TaxID=509200 RepID=UPI001FEB2DCD|nr:hypothetical protein [Sphaerisporangium album]
MPVAAMGGQYSFGPGVAASFNQVADDVRTVVGPDSGHFVPAGLLGVRDGDARGRTSLA